MISVIVAADSCRPNADYRESQVSGTPELPSLSSSKLQVI